MGNVSTGAGTVETVQGGFTRDVARRHFQDLGIPVVIARD